MKLSEVKQNAEYEVESVVGQTELCRRLLDMGFTPGRRIEVVTAAPWGRTFLIRIRGVLLALRRNAADIIILK